MADKPTAAFVLSLIGGIFILLGGVALAIGFSFLLGGVGAIIGIIGAIMGLIVLLGGVMLYQKPQSHTMWGVIILVLSIIAFPAAWGFGIGSLLAFRGSNAPTNDEFINADGLSTDGIDGHDLQELRSKHSCWSNTLP